MALSKSFLCGSQGAFDKDDNPAFTFAEKAARKGFGNAEFVMGYYKEVGVGGSKDIDAARMYYQLVSRAGRMRGWLIPNPKLHRFPTAILPFALETRARRDHGIETRA